MKRPNKTDFPIFVLYVFFVSKGNHLDLYFSVKCRVQISFGIIESISVSLKIEYHLNLANYTAGPICSKRRKLKELVKGHFVNWFSGFNIQYSDVLLKKCE